MAGISFRARLAAAPPEGAAAGGPAGAGGAPGADGAAVRTSTLAKPAPAGKDDARLVRYIPETFP
ncbi:hypothetical protein GCM10023082_66110 [Streptomyces tremellae]|uniref:Uncharacterized protein n=1 Tax=Streptomyces tremellae TaxID=1124239 RepID=A0ABP7GGS9_9ACTN